MTFGETVKRYREAQDLTLQDMAEDLKMTRQQINYIENNTINPCINTVILFADYFGLTIEAMYGRNRQVNYDNCFGTLSENLKRYKEESGLSYYAIEKETGIRDSNLIVMIKKTKNPKMETLIKLADLFEVSVDELVGRKLVEE